MTMSKDRISRVYVKQVRYVRYKTKETNLFAFLNIRINPPISTPNTKQRIKFRLTKCKKAVYDAGGVINSVPSYF